MATLDQYTLLLWEMCDNLAGYLIPDSEITKKQRETLRNGNGQMINASEDVDEANKVSDLIEDYDGKVGAWAQYKAFDMEKDMKVIEGQHITAVYVMGFVP